MGVELVHHQDDLLRRWIKLVAKRFDDGGKVGAFALGPHEDVAASGQGFADHEERGGAVARVLAIDPFRLARLDGQRRAHLGEQLLGGFVQAHLRAGGIVGPVVDFQHVFHGGDELRVGAWRDAPTLL